MVGSGAGISTFEVDHILWKWAVSPFFSGSFTIFKNDETPVWMIIEPLRNTKNRAWQSNRTKKMVAKDFQGIGF